MQTPIALFSFLLFLGFSFPIQATSLNGFNLSDALVPEQDILRGGPPRDGIPAIDHPKFVPASQVNYLRDDDITLGLVRDGKARAYPLRILIWHEIVNDHFNGEPVTVTDCPWCATAMVFDAIVNGRLCSYGVSGLRHHNLCLDPVP